MGRPWWTESLRTSESYESLATLFARRSFKDGLYRVHDADSGPAAQQLIAEAFPEFAARATPFGFDWLGRQFAIDSLRLIAGEPQVLMIEPGTGEVLEIPCDI